MDSTLKFRVGDFIFLNFKLKAEDWGQIKSYHVVVVVETIFEIFRQDSDFWSFLRGLIVLKPSKMDSTSKIRVGNIISRILLIFGVWIGI